MSWLPRVGVWGCQPGDTVAALCRTPASAKAAVTCSPWSIARFSGAAHSPHRGPAVYIRKTWQTSPRTALMAVAFPEFAVTTWSLMLLLPSFILGEAEDEVVTEEDPGPRG